MFLPHLSAAVRRLHDTGKSGCFCLDSFRSFRIPVQTNVQNNQQIYNPPQYNNNTNQVPPYQVVQPNPQGYVPPNYTSPTTKNE